MEESERLAKRERIARNKFTVLASSAGPSLRRATAEEADRQRRMQAAITDAMDRQREDLPQQDNSPTKERVARLAGVDELSPPIQDKDTRATSRAYKVEGVVDFYGAKPKRPDGKPAEDSKWGAEEEQGARFLVDVWHKASNGMPRVTSSYGGVPGSFGPRDGGVKRGKTEAHVDAHTKQLTCEAIIFSNFGVKGLQLVRWFVWETERVAKEGASVTEQMQHAGRRLAPFVRDEGRLWGLTFGSLQRIFYFSYAKWVAGERAASPAHPLTPQQIAARREARRRRV